MKRHSFYAGLFVPCASVMMVPEIPAHLFIGIVVVIDPKAVFAGMAGARLQ